MKNTLSYTLIIFSILSILSCNTKNVKQNRLPPTQEYLTLDQEIQQYLKDLDLDIGIALHTTYGDSFQHNGHKSYPMLSTFKIPVALKFLNYLEENNIPLHQKFKVSNKDLHKGTHSPFRDKYPNEDQSITYSEAINWMIGLSDNNITDILINQIGGVDKIQEFFQDDRFVIIADEKLLNRDWESSFLNTTTPLAFVQMLEKFDNGKFLNESNTTFLYQSLLNCQTGLKRIKGNLKGVMVAHKTGTGGKNKNNIIGAVNDVGIIKMPDMQKIYLAIFISKSKYTMEETEKVIADISEIIYEYYLKKSH